MEAIAKVIRVKGTNQFVKSAEPATGVDLKQVEDANGQPVISVVLTEDFAEAKKYPGYNNDAENTVQLTPDSGTLTVPFSCPLQGGTEVYEVVPVFLGEAVPNWIE